MQEIASDRIRLTAQEARDLSERSLRGIGYDDEEAQIIADHVMDAALCGYEYSGLPKILDAAEYPKARNPRTPLRALHETEVSVLYDGGNNVGMLAMHRATKAAIEKAQARGFAAVGVTNSWMSGRSGYYVEKVARADLIGMHTVSTSAQVAPVGGSRAALGTNPIAFGFPSSGEPFVVDIGTSAFMGTDLSFRARRGELLPEGVAIDPQGLPTREPLQARLGALLPFGGHKGYALALAMQAFGVFAGSGFNLAKDYGYLILAIKPDLLVPLEQFKREVSEMIARVKATPRQPDVDEIRIPSERSFRERARCLREGLVIDRRIYDALLKLAERQRS
jgi:LDH2 family malate/lactate/ureidoglycolate dehydrogenase